MKKRPDRVPKSTYRRAAVISALLLISVFTMSFNSYAATPVDSKLIPAGREILNYFESIYGKKMLGAIQVNVGAIEQCSGKTPVIAGYDLCGWNSDKWGDLYRKNIQDAINNMINFWEVKGGIPQLAFHWPNPLTEGGRFPDSQEKLTADQFNRIVTPGTNEYQTMMADLAKHADYMQQLADKNIPVLWRPLHEIDGGWFWWTDKNTPTNTAKLWRIVYNYLVNTRGFHNLIWVYSAGLGNPQGNPAKNAAYRKPFYPGAEYVDISGIDIYEVDYQDSGQQTFYNTTQSYQEAFKMMQEVSPGKMLALAECQALPNPDKMQSNDPNFAKWLWALPWWANTDANPCDWIKKTYNHDFVLTVDEVPDFQNGGNTTPADPDPVEPEPIDPGTVEPDPVDPGTTDPVPTDPTPSNPGCGTSDTGSPGCGTTSSVDPDPVDTEPAGSDMTNPNPVDTAPATETTIQAEEFSANSGGKRDTAISGYTGSGYFDMGGNGSWVEYRVNVDSGDSYELAIRYANGSAADRACDLIVNGVSQSTPFDITGDWTTWNDNTANVQLQDGTNTIRIQAATDRGGPNIDTLVLSGGSGTGDPGTVTPDPVEPDPAEPDPVVPDPVVPDPVEPGPVNPNPVDFSTNGVTTPLKDGDRILWVGNSLSDWNGPMGKCLTAIFAAQKDPINVEITTIIKGSTGLDKFATDASLGVVNAIRTGNYDLFVMQTSNDAWDTGSFNLDDTVRYAKQLSSEADRVGSETAVFFPHLWSWTWDCAYPDMTNTDCQWPGKDGEYMPVAIATHQRIADETGAMIMPAGIAWEEGALRYATEHGGNFDAFVGALYHDKIHQNANGMILNAFVCYTMLSGGKSPVGLRPQWPNAIANSDKYRPDLQDYLAEIAYKVGMEALKK